MLTLLQKQNNTRETSNVAHSSILLGWFHQPIGAEEALDVRIIPQAYCPQSTVLFCNSSHTGPQYPWACKTRRNGILTK
ncbi:hypothetical protein RHGRI_037991 [Rhododendron griersonianum]|uniref:Uncharacterized protein n=1 Tax=Rhododendron griersonianum TaxID=479676 RepID=A0AAV6HZQ2_9ERIC|nr:hypothetical protein RHGRI_037991 [Rhododendron griersonianum]